ncbi:MAG: hypothetical protein ACLP53_24160 [Isosphaeraceae bacterium]
MSVNLPVAGGEFLLYATEDGRTRLSVRVQDGTVWLSQAAIAELFQTTKQNVSLHLQNIYEDEELRPEATVMSSGDSIHVSRASSRAPYCATRSGSGSVRRGWTKWALALS